MNIEELIDILENEISVYEKLLQICRKETEALVKGKVSELDSIVKLQSELIRKIGQLEQMRAEWLSNNAHKFGVDADKLNMTFLISKTEGKISDYLAELQHRFSAVLAEHCRINDINRQLIEQALEFIDYTLSLMLDNSHPLGYASDGSLDKFQPDSIVDQKV